MVREGNFFLFAGMTCVRGLANGFEAAVATRLRLQRVEEGSVGKMSQTLLGIELRTWN